MPEASNLDVRIHFEIEGEGPPLVLMHGFGGSARFWRSTGLAGSLMERHRLILIDSRGHGESDKPHSGYAYAFSQRAGDVVAVLDEAGIEQADYFGYCLGGWIGLGVARYAPERLRVLGIGGAHPYGEDLAPYRAMLKDGMESALQALEEEAGAALPPPVREEILDNDVEALRMAYKTDRAPMPEIKEAMPLPCFMFAGSEDPLYPLVEQYARASPHTRFLRLEGLNHVQTALHLGKVMPEFERFLEETPSA
jgi:pimeloyl-ACP methyl ester carboxylesterase